MKQFKVLGLVFAGIMFASAPALSALLNVTGGTSTTLAAATGSDFSLGSETGLTGGSMLRIYDSGSATPFGLSLSAPTTVTFTYLGEEAGRTNTFTTDAGVFQNNGANAVGDSFSGGYLAGFIDFVLTSSGGFGSATAANNGPITDPLQFALAVLDDTSVIVLFNDGGIDTDFDDIAIRVDVSQVPLPAAAWLFLSAILGLLSVTGIRRASSRAA